MIIDKTLLDNLSAQAKASPRLRMHYDLRDSDHDSSQRMLNAVEPGSVLPIHRHKNSSETVVVLSGKIKWMYYNDQGQVIETFTAKAGDDICGISVPAGQWHTMISLESGSVVLSCKDGPWEALQEEDIMKL